MPTENKPPKSTLFTKAALALPLLALRPLAVSNNHATEMDDTQTTLPDDQDSLPVGSPLPIRAPQSILNRQLPLQSLVSQIHPRSKPSDLPPLPEGLTSKEVAIYDATYESPAMGLLQLRNKFQDCEVEGKKINEWLEIFSKLDLASYDPHNPDKWKNFHPLNDIDRAIKVKDSKKAQIIMTDVGNILADLAQSVADYEPKPQSGINYYDGIDLIVSLQRYIYAWYMGSYLNQENGPHKGKSR